MGNINERLDKVKLLVQNTDFLEGKGLSNEINIRIFCYKPEDEMPVRHFIKKIKDDKTLNCNLIEFNLYEVFISICNDKRITRMIPKMEKTKGKEKLLKELQNIVTSATFVEKIKYEPHNIGDVLVLTGIGEVFPFMRIHSLLESLQPYFADIPILVFYPGVFDGHQVKLFNRLKPNNYYRAFNVI